MGVCISCMAALWSQRLPVGILPQLGMRRILQGGIRRSWGWELSSGGDIVWAVGSKAISGGRSMV